MYIYNYVYIFIHVFFFSTPADRGAGWPSQGAGGKSHG